MTRRIGWLAAALVPTAALIVTYRADQTRAQPGPGVRPVAAVEPVPPGGPEQNALRMIREGRQTFRHDTFGDEAFWGDALHLHLAVVGEKLGGVGPGLSPKAALEVGLKVDM